MHFDVSFMRLFLCHLRSFKKRMCICFPLCDFLLRRKLAEDTVRTLYILERVFRERRSLALLKAALSTATFPAKRERPVSRIYYGTTVHPLKQFLRSKIAKENLNTLLFQETTPSFQRNKHINSKHQKRI